jgi:5-oxoprolinase (ATP-hydrolysing)
VLEWITWGGGGLGDPLTRPPERVAQEVHRRLVTVQGAKDNYGVVVDPHTFNFDKFATSTLRSRKREQRAKESYSTYNTIDRGGTLSELMRKCEAETGLKPPVPQWEKRIYGPHAGLEYVRNWYEKMKTEGMERWDKA